MSIKIRGFVALVLLAMLLTMVLCTFNVTLYSLFTILSIHYYYVYIYALTILMYRRANIDFHEEY